MTAMLTGLSIVIICRNEADYIEDCLVALGVGVAGEDMPVEILLVDGRSEDETVARAQAWASQSTAGRLLRIIVEDSWGYGQQRNVGVRAARYPWVAFISADVRVPAGWLRQVAVTLREPVDLAVGRFDLVDANARPGWMAAATRTVYPSRCAEPWVERCSTVHVVAARARLLDHPFDEGLDGCEDKDLAFRLRNSPAWGGGAMLQSRPQHLARESVPRFLRKLYRESRSLADIRQHHGPAFPDCFGWHSHCLRVVVMLAVALPVEAVAYVFLGGSYAGPLAAATMVGAGCYRAGWRRRSSFPIVPLAVLHVVAMWAVAAGWMASRIRHTRLAASNRRGTGEGQPAGHAPRDPEDHNV